MQLRVLHYLNGALLAIFCTSCGATTRMGKAVVTEVDGMPCFAVPKNSETRAGVPLYTLSVTKENASDASTGPEQVWIIRVVPPGNTILVHPENCIRYGATPKFAEQETLEPLQPFQIYAVDIQAVPEGSNLRGYTADFCMKPAENGKVRVQVVPWDETAGKWRYDVCAKP